MTNTEARELTDALRRAFYLGQTYWQQADSEYVSQNKKADETRAKYDALVAETLLALSASAAPAAAPKPNPLCGLSWNGFNLEGDKASIEEVKRLMHCEHRMECLQAEVLELRQQVQADAGADEQAADGAGER